MRINTSRPPEPRKCWRLGKYPKFRRLNFDCHGQNITVYFCFFRVHMISKRTLYSQVHRLIECVRLFRNHAGRTAKINEMFSKCAGVCVVAGKLVFSQRHSARTGGTVQEAPNRDKIKDKRQHKRFSLPMLYAQLLFVMWRSLRQLVCYESRLRDEFLALIVAT